VRPASRAYMPPPPQETCLCTSITEWVTHLAPNAIASIAPCSASSIRRCLCRSIRWRSFSFLPPPAGCCVSLAASAEGSTACTASSTVLRRPALADGGVLGRLTSPRDVLASPLLLPAAAALLDGPPPPPPFDLALALLLLALLLRPTPSTPRTERLNAATGTPQPGPRYSQPTRVLDTPHRSPHTWGRQFKTAHLALRPRLRCLLALLLLDQVAAMRSAASSASAVSCLAACFARSLVAAAFLACAVRSSSRNTCAA
jgi:hypothetical protein